MPKKMVINHKIRLANPSDSENIAQVAIETYVETYGARGAHGIDNRAKANKLYGHDYVTTSLPALLKERLNVDLRYALVAWGLFHRHVHPTKKRWI